MRHQVRSLIHPDVEHAKRFGRGPKPRRDFVVPVELRRRLAEIEEEPVDAPEIGSNCHHQRRGGERAGQLSTPHRPEQTAAEQDCHEEPKGTRLERPGVRRHTRRLLRGGEHDPDRLEHADDAE